MISDLIIQTIRNFNANYRYVPHYTSQNVTGVIRNIIDTLATIRQHLHFQKIITLIGRNRVGWGRQQY